LSEAQTQLALSALFGTPQPAITWTGAMWEARLGLACTKAVVRTVVTEFCGDASDSISARMWFQKLEAEVIDAGRLIEH
jgi:hypothetical protein